MSASAVVIHYEEALYQVYGPVDLNHQDVEFIGKTIVYLQINLFDSIHSLTYSALYISLVQIDLIVICCLLGNKTSLNEKAPREKQTLRALWL